MAFLGLPGSPELAWMPGGGFVLALCLVLLALCVVIVALLLRARRRDAVVLRDVRNQEAQLRRIIETADEGIWMLDPLGRTSYMNEHMSALLGVPLAQAAGRPGLELVFEEDRPLMQRLLGRPGLESTECLELRFRHRDGSLFWGSLNVSPLRNAQGASIGLLGLLRDITESKRTVDEIASLARFSAESPNPVLRILRDQSLVYSNAAGEVLLDDWGCRIGQQVPESIQRIVTAVLESNQTRDVELALAGRRFSIFFTPVPEAGYVNLYGRDVTEHRRAEDAVRESEERYRRLFEGAALGVFQTTFEGKLISANPAFARMFGFGAAQEVMASIHNIGAELYVEDRVRRRIVERLLQGQEPINAENQYRRRDGSVFIGNLFAWVVKDGEGRPLYLEGFLEDITARKQAEEEVRQLHERERQQHQQLEFERQRLQAILQHIPAGVMIAEAPSGRMILVNEQAERILHEPVPPQRSIAEMNLKVKVFYLDGQPYPMARWPLNRSLQQGEIVTDEEMSLLRSDGTCAAISTSSAPILDHEGRMIAGVLIFTDISDRKRAEAQLREQTAQLAEADRHKDEFLAMLAHELRNPLAPIQNAVQVLRLAGTNEGLLQRQRDVIDRQVRQMTRLVDDLLDVGRISRGRIELKKERVTLADVVARASETVSPLIEEHKHQLTVDLPPEPILLEVDPARLAQAIGNLLNNAAKYMEDGGQIWLSGGCEESQVVIKVRDNGMGIRPELLPDIFDLFIQADQSLDRKQGGLGIGLNLVHRLVEMHGGSVQAFSAGLGKGSEFTIRLPALEPCPAQAAGPAPASAEEEPSAETPARKVLVVDDNVDAAHSLGELLELWGHQVRVAFDGPGAIETARVFQPEVVLLDIGLPRMDGYEVARLMRAEPALAGMYMAALTGYGQQEDRRRAMEAGFDRHFTKPVDLEALRELLVRPLTPSNTVNGRLPAQG